MASAPEKRLGARRIATYLTLLAGTLALFAAMGFFMFRDSHPTLAVALGRVVWGGLIAVVVGGGALALAGIVQALFGGPAEEGQEDPPR